MSMVFAPVFFLALLVAGNAMAQQDCDARAKTESDAVTRDFTARSPGKGTGAAQQAWAKELHDALEAVQLRHEACRRANRPAANSPQMQRMEACLDANRRQFDALDKRFQGRTLSVQEMSQQRTEQQKLLDERNACTLQK